MLTHPYVTRRPSKIKVSQVPQKVTLVLYDYRCEINITTRATTLSLSFGSLCAISKVKAVSAVGDSLLVCNT